LAIVIIGFQNCDSAKDKFAKFKTKNITTANISLGSGTPFHHSSISFSGSDVTQISGNKNHMAPWNTSDSTTHSNDFTCALISDGRIICWGDNSFGQLGDESYRTRSYPKLVSGLKAQAVQISIGGQHACALLANGEIQCWGRNKSGQLGDGLQLQSPLPKLVTGLLNKAVKITAGFAHTCALLIDDKVQCWGDNQSSQLGSKEFQPHTENIKNNGRFSQNAILATYLDLQFYKIIELSAGGFHTCALASKISNPTDTAVFCWGENGYGQLGNGETRTDFFIPPTQKEPQEVNNLLSSTKSLSSGMNNTCALLNDGQIQCWGVVGSQVSPSEGFISYLTTGTPKLVEGLISKAVSIVSGDAHWRSQMLGI